MLDDRLTMRGKLERMMADAPPSVRREYAARIAAKAAKAKAAKAAKDRGHKARIDARNAKRTNRRLMK